MSNTKSSTISVVLPCFNEEAVIADVIENVHSWLEHNNVQGEIIVVNNGSTDHTQEILNQLSHKYDELIVVTHKRNQGFGGSIRSGCDAARGDVIACMDSDGQYDAYDFDLLLPHLQSIDLVAGVRGNRSDSAIRKINSFLWNLLVRWLLHIKANDVDCTMKVFRRSVWPLIRPQFGTGISFSAELFFRIKQNNIIWKQVVVRHFPRKQGNATGIQIIPILGAFWQLGILLMNRHRISYQKSSSPQAAY